jgi:AraC-like DNA-binding protein
METSQNADISNIRVEVWAAHRHRWEAGQKYHHDPSHHRNPTLQCQLWLMQEGCLEVNSRDKKWRIESGEAFLLPVSLERDIDTLQSSVWLSLRLWITVFNKFNLLQNISLPAQWRPEAVEQIRMESWMEQVVQEYRLESANSRLIVDGLARALVGLCWPHISSVSLDSAIHSPLPNWLIDTLRSMTEEPANSISYFSHAAGFSPAQFRRAFHQRIGATPRDFLKHKRLETARHLLEHTTLPLRVIAVRVGLRDATHFSNAFKEAFDLTPSQYRISLERDIDRSPA